MLNVLLIHEFFLHVFINNVTLTSNMTFNYLVEIQCNPLQIVYIILKTTNNVAHGVHYSLKPKITCVHGPY
jgi:hypothetical protein